jgi:hypothetical protein
MKRELVRITVEEIFSGYKSRFKKWLAEDTKKLWFKREQQQVRPGSAGCLIQK